MAKGILTCYMDQGAPDSPAAGKLSEVTGQARV